MLRPEAFVFLITWFTDFLKKNGSGGGGVWGGRLSDFFFFFFLIYKIIELEAKKERKRPRGNLRILIDYQYFSIILTGMHIGGEKKKRKTFFFFFLMARG